MNDPAVGSEDQSSIPLGDVAGKRDSSKTLCRCSSTTSLTLRNRETGAQQTTEASEAEKRRVSRWDQAIVLITGFLANFQVQGQAFGVFQAYHTKSIATHNAILPDEEASNRAAIAVIGSLSTSGMPLLMGFFLTPILQRVQDFRWVTVPGACLMVLGYVMSSWSTRLWHLVLLQGLCNGVGCGMLLYPIYLAAPEYFGKWQGTAVGLITAGAGLGGLFYAPITDLLLTRMGMRWTLRVLGIIQAVICPIVGFLTRPPRQKKRDPRTICWTTAVRPEFWLSVVAGFANNTSVGIPLAFGPDFSASLKLSSATGALLLAVFNGTGSAGRISMGFLADKLGRHNTLNTFTLITAITVLALWLPSAISWIQEPWVAFVVLYGSFAPSYSTLYPCTLLDVFGSEFYFAVSGMVHLARGLGAIAGPPLGGQLVLGCPHACGDPGAFWPMICFTAALLFISAICLIWVRVLDSKKKGWKWIA